MKNRYEGLLVLNVKGNEESANEIVSRLETDIKKAGAEIERIERIGSRSFTYAAGDLTTGYYANFVFHSEPAVIAKLRDKFKLDTDVYRQNYMKAPIRKSSIGRPPRPVRVEKPAPAANY
jgi:small subunit ribosomal protein S6